MGRVPASVRAQRAACVGLRGGPCDSDPNDGPAARFAAEAARYGAGGERCFRSEQASLRWAAQRPLRFRSERRSSGSHRRVHPDRRTAGSHKGFCCATYHRTCWRFYGWAQIFQMRLSPGKSLFAPLSRLRKPLRTAKSRASPAALWTARRKAGGCGNSPRHPSEAWGTAR